MKQGRDLKRRRRALADPGRVYHLARREARGRGGGGDHRRRRPSGQRRMRPLRPLWRERGGRGAGDRGLRAGDRGKASTAPGFRPCCRLAPRATRSTARCGTSRRRCRDGARPSLPVLRRCMPSRRPSPSRSPRLRRWRPARARLRRYPLLKLKLGGDGDEARLAAVREAVPKARLIADANEAWRASDLERLLAAAKAAGVELIEQPLPAGDDAALQHIARIVPVCADESVHDRASLRDHRQRATTR